METVHQWTDEELCDVYDLQLGYEEVLLDFVRHEREIDVSDLMAVLPHLYAYEEKELEPYIFRSDEVSPNNAATWGLGEHYRNHDYIYRDSFGAYKSADDLREVFEGTFQSELGLAHPEILAVLGNDFSKAKNHYSQREFDRLRAIIPERFQRKMNQLLAKFPEDIREKAMQTPIYGCTNLIERSRLTTHANLHVTSLDRYERATERVPATTIVAAYDLQERLSQISPEISMEVTEVIHNARTDMDGIRRQYGSKAWNALKETAEETLELASMVDLVHTEERIPAIQNHKICLYGTEEQILAIPYMDCSYEISNRDMKTILNAWADHYEKEGFAQRYVPKAQDPVMYWGKTFQVIGRSLPDEKDLLPHWEITFGDGKTIRAAADEIIPSAIPEVQRELYLPDPTPRKLEDAALSQEERTGSVTRKEAERKLSHLLKELQQSGVKPSGIMELLQSAGRKLQGAQGR